MQGKTHLGFTEVATNLGGNTNYRIAFAVAAGEADAGSLITATATEILVYLPGAENDEFGSTSEFSGAVEVR